MRYDFSTIKLKLIDCCSNTKNRFLNFYLNSKSHIRNIKIRITSYDYSPTKDFIRFVLEYGILTNIMLWGVFNYHITIQSIFGYGILWYFIKYEFRNVYEKWRGR